ncbi:MAG: phosphatase PAP2 family protein [Candidatus Promineifilaceae bacterium]|nr:phosphatase PAP2 family protein [Candidatus Promineifilaceae bacterium]
MEQLYEPGLEAIRWLQANYPQFAAFMIAITETGRFEFYLALVPLVYWCIHKQFGRQAAYLLAIAYLTNTSLKHLFRTPRPDWLDPSLGIVGETSYGVPSGHTQIATVIYLFLAYWVRRTWVWLLAAVLIFLMGLSRVYLGVHFPHDVLAGFLLGLLILIVYLIWVNFYQESFRNRILGQRLLVAVLLPLALATLYIVSLLLLGDPDQSVVWSPRIEGAELAALEDAAAAIGILLGLGIGFILEPSRVHFVVDGSFGRRALRYALGLLVTLAIWRGLAFIFPDTPLWLALPLRVFRYWLAGIWVAYYAPLLFVRVGLATASPEPDVRLSISEGSIMKE